MNYGLKSENLTIVKTTIEGADGLSADNRTIARKGLFYNATKQYAAFKVFEDNRSLRVEYALEDRGSGLYVKIATNGTHYAKLGWLGEPYVALNNNANKHAKLIIEQGLAPTEKKTLVVGETWDIGGGWSLTARSINASTSPRQAWLVLSYEDSTLDDRVVSEGSVYTYVEMSLAGESYTPSFVTYTDAIFAGAHSDMVQLRFTWAISREISIIRSGDVFGSMRVTDDGSSDGTIKTWNEDSSISLSKNSTVDIMGNIKFRVADSDTARFYPKVDYEIISGGCFNSTINGYKFKDNNVNGIQDAGERGLPGWIIQLRSRDSCTNTNISRVTRTNAQDIMSLL